jgi:hypothetical protein
MTLRFFLPFDNFKLQTKLTVAEVQSRLSNSIEPKKNFRFSFNNKRTKPYEGEVIGTSFKINRIINYRNSFLPVIIGEISSRLDKTEISVRMRPVIAVLIFMSFWLGVVGLVCLGILIAAIAQFIQLLQHGFSPMILIPFIMFAFGYTLITFGYRIEAQKSKDFLKTLLEAEQYV